MKTISRVGLIVTLICVMLGSWAGCSKKESTAQNAKVDVQAQIAALKNPDLNARSDALVALSNAGEKAAPAVPALIETLKDKDADVRRLAAFALQQIGSKASAATPAIKELLNDPDRRVAMQAVNTLRAIDPTAKDLKTENVTGPRQ